MSSPTFKREGVKHTTTAGFSSAHTRVAYQFLVPRQNCRTNSRLFVSILHEAQLPHPVLLKVLPVGRDQRLDVRRVFTICARPTDRFKALKMTPRQQNSGVATDAIMLCLWKRVEFLERREFSLTASSVFRSCCELFAKAPLSRSLCSQSCTGKNPHKDHT